MGINLASMENSLIQLLTLWDNALNESLADAELAATLDIPLVRDLVMAAASSVSSEAMSRAIAGAEIRGFLPRGSAALSGRIASTADGAWLDGVTIGEGVEFPGRLESLRSITENAMADESIVGQARVNAGTLHAWASWLLGYRADARGELLAVQREGGDTALAGSLLQVIDVQQGR
jgi:hypothetical protein